MREGMGKRQTVTRNKEIVTSFTINIKSWSFRT